MTLLSNRQYAMLQAFLNANSSYMTISHAQAFDQRPFRSMLVRKYIEYTPGRGFHITKKGRNAWMEFTSTDIGRKDARMPLTALFDPTAYVLHRKDNVKAMPPRKAMAQSAVA